MTDDRRKELFEEVQGIEEEFVLAVRSLARDTRGVVQNRMDRPFSAEDSKQYALLWAQNIAEVHRHIMAISETAKTVIKELTVDSDTPHV